MIHMGLLNIISHMALREHFPIREIARRAGLLRNTIKSCPNSGTVEPKFETDGIPCPDLAHGGPRALSGPSPVRMMCLSELWVDETTRE